MIKLSERLAAIASRVPAGAALADIGSDHALLPCYLAEQGIVRTAIAGEINEGPYLAACEQVRQHRLQARISVRRGDGLSVLHTGEADVVVIAGMGGGTIVRILADGKEKLAYVRRLLLQPNAGEKLVREWLIAQGWLLAEETILLDGGKIYEVIVADCHPQARRLNSALLAQTGARIGGGQAEDLVLEMGPHLLAAPPPAFFAKWEGELIKREKVMAGLKRSINPHAQRKLALMKEQTRKIREVLQCLQTVKP
ncbi:MAG TPA: class I SAM-dependent methyltransferase [Bacilli bacterium]